MKGSCLCWRKSYLWKYQNWRWSKNPSFYYIKWQNWMPSKTWPSDISSSTDFKNKKSIYTCQIKLLIWNSKYLAIVVHFLVDKFGVVNFASPKPKGPRALKLCLSAGLQNLLLWIFLRGNDILVQKAILKQKVLE